MRGLFLSCCFLVASVAIRVSAHRPQFLHCYLAVVAVCRENSHLLCHWVNTSVKQHISFVSQPSYCLQALISCVLDAVLYKKTQHQMLNFYVQIRHCLAAEPLPNHSAKISLCISEIHG